MLKQALTMMLVAGMATMGMAQDDGEGTAEAGIDVVSAYVFRGETLNDEVNVQPALSGTWGALGLGTWGNFNTDSSQFDEIDYTASYDLPTGDDCPVGASLGYTEYTYPTQLDAAGAGLEADREVSLTLSPVDFPFGTSVMVAYGIEGPYLDEGIYVEVNAGHDLELNEDITLNGSATVGIELGDNVVDTGLAFVALGVGTAVGPIDIGVTFIIETDDGVRLVDEDVVGTASISIPL